jgi:hypothetical protein
MKQTMVFGTYGLVDFAKKIDSLNKQKIKYEITLAKGIYKEDVVILSWTAEIED